MNACNSPIGARIILPHYGADHQRAVPTHRFPDRSLLMPRVWINLWVRTAPPSSRLLQTAEIRQRRHNHSAPRAFNTCLPPPASSTSRSWIPWGLGADAACNAPLPPPTYFAPPHAILCWCVVRSADMTLPHPRLQGSCETLKRSPLHLISSANNALSNLRDTIQGGIVGGSFFGQ